MRSASLSTLRVLRAFMNDPTRPRYGLDLIREVRLKSGILYPILARLEGTGVLQGRWEDLDESEAGRRRRRYFLLTAEGESMTRAILEELTGVPADGPRSFVPNGLEWA